MARTVTVTTGARLHFGPLSYRPAEGRHFGGVGLMVDRPGVHIELRKASVDEVIGDAANADRVLGWMTQAREQTPPVHRPPPLTVNIVRVIAPHSGLGSGTQLGQAVARGMAEWAGEPEVPVESLASRVERGRRSAVGLYGFAAGGLIVDAGKHDGESIGALACRLPFPSDWRVLLLTPEHGRLGLSGGPEELAFERLGAMPGALTDRLCHLVLTELLPAVVSADFDAFSDAVFGYGSRVGEFFAPVQGGTFGDARTDELIGRLTDLGIRGVGQTSWGPTLFVFVSSEERGWELAERLDNDLAGRLSLRDCRLVAPLNCGAIVAEHD